MRLLPSQAHKLVADELTQLGHGTWSYQYVQAAAACLAAVDAVPDELVLVDGLELAGYVGARAHLATFVAMASRLGNNAMGLDGNFLRQLRDVLAKCPDRVIPLSVSPIAFVTDDTLRNSIRQDLASTEISIRDADWKAATVMAGSAAEALLLWAVQVHDPVKLAAAVSTVKPKKSDPLRWDLHELTEIAETLATIKPPTAQQLRIMKDFRNLIHPGRAIRTSMVCDRGTAYAAAAAVDFVIRDLT